MFKHHKREFLMCMIFIVSKTLFEQNICLLNHRSQNKTNTCWCRLLLWLRHNDNIMYISWNQEQAWTFSALLLGHLAIAKCFES